MRFIYNNLCKQQSIKMIDHLGHGRKDARLNLRAFINYRGLRELGCVRLSETPPYVGVNEQGKGDRAAKSESRRQTVGRRVIATRYGHDVAQSCPTLCDPLDCSTPGLPVHHQLPEFAQPRPSRA